MKSMIWVILSGILIAISSPGYFIPFSFIFGFVLLFSTVDEKSYKTTVLYSFISGFVYSLLSFYWTAYAVTYYGGVSVYLGIILLFLLAAVFSLFQFVTSFSVFYLLKGRYRDLSLLLFPFVWLVFEILREFFPFGGFPWNLTGYSLSYFNSIAQISAFFSVYGLSFIAIFIPSFIYFTYKAGRMFFLAGILSVFSLLISLHILGYERAKRFSFEGIRKKVAVIQGNITEDIKLQNKNPVEVIDIYSDLIKEASVYKPDMIILPESALPFLYINGDQDLKSYFLNRIKDVNIPILLGSDTAIFKKGDIVLHNSMILLDKKHQIVDMYHKVKLVPFGEYVPFPFKIFSYLFPYLEGYDFSSGEGKKVLRYKDWLVVPLICFEAIFPDFVATSARYGNIMINISNDGWFGKTVAPYQHFEMARVRAIETGLFLIRGTNTGISAVINPAGIIEKKIGIFKRGFIISDVYLRTSDTFWVKNHRKVTYGFLLLLLFSLIIIELMEKRYEKYRYRRD